MPDSAYEAWSMLDNRKSGLFPSRTKPACFEAGPAAQAERASRSVAARVVRTTVAPIRHAIVVAVAVDAIRYAIAVAVALAAMFALARGIVINDAAGEQGAQDDQ
jgi:hypothetical protein